MTVLTQSKVALKGTTNHFPTYRNRIYLVFATVHVNGVRAAVLHYSQRLIYMMTKRHGKPAKDGRDTTDMRFTAQSNDEHYECLNIQSSNSKWGLFYVSPSDEELIHRVIRSLPVRLEDYTFVDLGAGKGLPLLLASGYPFNGIIGVEYSKTLADLANRNIRTHEELNGFDPRIQCILGDAVDFEFPNQPTVLYLFNPFQGKVMDRVLTNLEKSLRRNPRDLWVLYLNPWESRKFRRSSSFETIEWNLEYTLHRSVCR